MPGLRDVPARRLHETELALGRDPGIGRRFARPPALPVLDGIVLTEWPRDAAPPAIPLLVGTNRDEGVFWFDLINPDGSAVPGLPSPADDRRAGGDDRRPDGSLPAGGERGARGDRRRVQAEIRMRVRRDIISAVYTDAVFRLRALECARRHAEAGHPTFLYEFARPLAPPAHGAPHTTEIPFIFGTHAHPFFTHKLGHGEEVDRLSDFMLDSWARFARTGVPGAEWARLSPGGENVNVLGEAGVVHSVVRALHPERLAAWQCL